jgi:hypothetical protein
MAMRRSSLHRAVECGAREPQDDEEVRLNRRVSRLLATTAAALTIGGLGAASSLGAAAAKKTAAPKVGHACVKVGKTGTTAKGKKVVCTKVGKKLKWELVKPKKK